METGSIDPTEITIADVHEAFESGELTAAELVDWYVRRIETFDEKLRAILTVNPAARERAEELDAAFDSAGFVGPLHGIPTVLKDNHATHDVPTTAGSKCLEGSTPHSDAFIVRRIREAGGIVLAKANLQEFSFGVDTVSSLGGETRNAYSLEHRPSGSSGGTSAAIAANFGTIGTGSDTCSSVRSPPAFNNLVGIRPTIGLLSRTGIVPLSTTQDTPGPITRTVEDAARMLDAMAGYDPEDPVTALGVDSVPEDGYAAHLDPDGLAGARIGVAREYFGLEDETLEYETEAGWVTDLVDAAIDDMAAAGATIVDPVTVPGSDSFDDANVAKMEIKRDLERFLEEWYDDDVPKTLAELVDSGRLHPWVQANMENPQVIDVDVDAVDEDPAYLRNLARRSALERETLARMADDELDALVYPPSAVPPVPFPERQPFSELRCELASFTGLPAIVVPAGFTPNGLPVGVELLGRPFAEGRLLELAYAYETASQHREPPEQFGSPA